MKIGTRKVYNGEQAQTAAQSLQIWAYTSLLTSKESEVPYPFVGSSTVLLQDGSWGLILPKSSRPRTPKPLKTPTEHIRAYKSVKRGLTSSVGKAEKLVMRVNRERWNSIPAWLTQDLGNSITQAIELLSKLAKTESKSIAQYAANHLAVSALKAAVELEQLSFRQETFPLLQNVAHQLPFWAAVYSPHPKEQQETLKRIQKLEVAVQHSQRPKASRWSNRDNVAGKFAFAMGSTLSRIDADANLKRTLNRKAVSQSASPEEIAQFPDANLVVRTPDAESDKQWIERLTKQGWPRWVVELHSLPPLSDKSAAAWFEIGWTALQEAAGDITVHPQLKALGKTNAGYCDKRQIKMRLRKAFLSRFGSGFVLFGTVSN